ncbi:MAG TPA: M48 family metallopeptidase [Bryobacteraceae bacterium]|nr:M48 family metallopeptidase [Bryobacteraceae bacterium]
MRFWCALTLVICFAAAPLSAGDKKDDPSQIGNRDASRGLNFYSLESEIALGKQLAEEVERQSKILDDPIISEYVNRMGQNLVRNSDAKVPFTFKIVEADEVNAFALPGGYVFVNTGLIKMADEESEFAGALAHEIAHVAARHMTRQASRSELTQILTLPLSILLGGLPGIAVRQGANLAIPMTFLSFSRKDESEADYLGLQYMYAAGYDPTGAISIFEKMESLERGNPNLISKIFATHPMDADRIRNAEKEIQEILPPRPEYVVTTSMYHDIRARLMALQSRHRLEPKDNRPHLRVGPRDPDGSGTDADSHPTIQRRHWSE